MRRKTKHPTPTQVVQQRCCELQR